MSLRARLLHTARGWLVLVVVHSAFMLWVALGSKFGHLVGILQRGGHAFFVVACNKEIVATETQLLRLYACTKRPWSVHTCNKKKQKLWSCTLWTITWRSFACECWWNCAPATMWQIVPSSMAILTVKSFWWHICNARKGKVVTPSKMWAVWCPCEQASCANAPNHTEYLLYYPSNNFACACEHTFVSTRLWTHKIWWFCKMLEKSDHFGPFQSMYVFVHWPLSAAFFSKNVCMTQGQNVLSLWLPSTSPRKARM